MWMYDGYKVMVIVYLIEVVLVNCGFDFKIVEKDGIDD